jgi:hypothetical protein
MSTNANYQRAQFLAGSKFLADEAIRLWLASGDPVDDCPEVWERWSLLCEAAGVDPVEFLEAARELMGTGAIPLLPCGHSAGARNVYHPGGSQTRVACKSCASENETDARMAKCHPDRRHHAKSLCYACYRRGWNRKGKTT